MKHFFTGLVMTLGLLIWNSGYAQRVQNDISLSASGGSVSNSYLIPQTPEWNRSNTTAYTTFSGSGRLRWTGSSQNLSVSGSGHHVLYFDDRPSSSGGFLTSTYRRRIFSSVSAKAIGGMSHISSSYNRNLQWAQIGADWTITPFARLEATVGSTWRSYSGLDEVDLSSDRYDSYGLGFQFWPAYRWQLQLQFYSSLAHITRPGDGFAGSVSISRYLSNGSVIMLRSGLEQYTLEFQNGDHLGSITPQNEAIILEDRFHRTSLRATFPAGNRLTLTASLEGLLWFSSEDDQIEPDFMASAGFHVPFSIRRSRSGQIQNLRWQTHSQQNEVRKQAATLVVQYRGNQTLYITGDFNDWDEPGIPLQKVGRNRHHIQLNLSPGIYEYKIRKRDNDRHEWLDLPDNATTVSDGFGGSNGRLFIDY